MSSDTLNIKPSTDSGPFGNYNRNSIGHVLNALHRWGIPMTKCEEVIPGKSEIKLHNKSFASYRYFDGIDQPLFRFQEPIYNAQRSVLTRDNDVKPAFRLQLSSHDTVGLIINGTLASKELHHFIKDILSSNILGDSKYELHKACGAFFQGGSDNPEGNWIYIEFWKPEGAQAFVDYINTNFTYPKNIFTYPKNIWESHD